MAAAATDAPLCLSLARMGHDATGVRHPLWPRLANFSALSRGVIVGATFRRHDLQKSRCKLLKGFIKTALSCGFYKPLEFCWISYSRSLLSLCDEFCH
jgi:hypothetical protein